MNKKRMLIYTLVLFSCLFLNHLRYGNSNSTISQYEIVKLIKHRQIIQKRSKILGDYMHSRISFYNQFKNDRYKHDLAVWYYYELLQNRNNNEN